jgi:LuxR family maltose regulon positive regulatory protein
MGQSMTASADVDAAERATTPCGDPIMTAKFLVPAVKAPVVDRPRLLERLSAGVRGPLTLVSAPAGSGKTVLVSTWAASGAALGPVIWISLDEEDDLPGVFWSYVLAGLVNGGVDVGPVAPPDRLETVDHALLVRLAASLSERSTPVVLVLDNAEGLSRQAIFDGLDFLVRHAAGQLRLVFVTRVDPNLHLPQYRLDGSLTEIRFPELAFTQQEARELLTDRRPDVPDNVVLAFSDRTRGWAAGLRLVGVDDGRDGEVCDTVDFPGTDIALYFRSEVLDAQSPRMRDFLLATSVVDVLYADLAACLSGSRDAGPMLRELSQASIFVDAVHDAGEEAWTFHPLVRDLLRAQLRHESPQKPRRLHRKAARWLADARRTTEAVEQHAAADDWEDAAERLVADRAVARLLAGTVTAGFGEIFARMPAGTPGPAAAVTSAALAVLEGDLDACDKHLRRAEELVKTTVSDQAALPLAVALTAMARAAATAEAEEALASATAVQDLWVELGVAPDAETTALLSYCIGRSHFVQAEFTSARDMFAAAVRSAGTDDIRWLRARSLAQLALVDAMAGGLQAAAGAARGAAESLRGPDAGEPDPAPSEPAPAAAHVALAWVCTEQTDLEGARRHVEDAWVAQDSAGDPICDAALVLVRARLLRLGDDLPGALRLLSHWRERRPLRTPQWLVHRLDAAEATMLVAQGEYEAAETLVRRFAIEDVPACLLAHAWVKLSGGGAAESGRSARQVMKHPGVPLELRVEASLLGAASAIAMSRPEAAAEAIDEALQLASPEGMRRPLDEAPPQLRALLRQREQRRQAAVAAAPPIPAPGLPGPRRGGQLPERPPVVTLPRDVLVQPLTAREHEVLTYLDELMPTEEIAARMFVSVNTVKTHVRAILRKLAAERRNEAVRRARELGLV